MRFRIEVNQELEGWDIVEIDGIQSDELVEDSIVATFYEQERAYSYLYMLNDY